MIIFPSSSSSSLLSLLLQEVTILLILIYLIWFLCLYLQNIVCVLAPGSHWLFSLSCSLVSAQWGGQFSPPGCFHHWPAAWEPGCPSGTFFEMLPSQPQFKLIPAIPQHPEQYFRLIDIVFFPLFFSDSVPNDPSNDYRDWCPAGKQATLKERAACMKTTTWATGDI